MNIILLITVVVTAIVAIFAAGKWIQCNNLNAEMEVLINAFDKKLTDAKTKTALEVDALHKQLSAKNTEILTLTEKNNEEFENSSIVIEGMRAKLQHAEADRVELRAEKVTAENKLADALKDVDYLEAFKDNLLEQVEALKLKIPIRPQDRARYAKGRFLPRGVFRPSTTTTGKAVDLAKLPNPSHRLTHGLTVKNPTEDEAKAIFAEAKMLGIPTAEIELSNVHPWIWYAKSDRITCCVTFGLHPKTFVTPPEFIARMQPLKRVSDLGEKEVIHCPTLEEAEAICKLMDEAGLRWRGGNSYLEDNYWGEYGSEMCYHPKSGSKSGRYNYENDRYTIHQAADFLRTQANKG